MSQVTFSQAVEAAKRQVTDAQFEDIQRLMPVVMVPLSDGSWQMESSKSRLESAERIRDYIDAILSAPPPSHEPAAPGGDQPSKEWLLKMADAEDKAGCTSVGGLAVEVGLYTARGGEGWMSEFVKRCMCAIATAHPDMKMEPVVELLTAELARAIAAQGRAGDGLLPVTEEWLLSVLPFRSRGGSSLGVDIKTNGVFRGELEFKWADSYFWVSIFGVRLMELSTRGDVRRLCAALGIPTTTNAKELS